MNSSIISAQELISYNDALNVVVLDVSPPSNKSNLTPSFPDEMIKGAHLVSIKNELSLKESDFPNTFPSTSQFNDFCKSVGINSQSDVIIYDNLGIYSAPRVWWIFKVMGFPKVRVLNGGLSAWKELNGETVPRIKLSRPNNGTFISNPDFSSIKKYEDILLNLSFNKFQIIDARSEGRFSGESPEPRAHLKSGSISNSSNIPFKKVLTTDGKLKSSSELQALFKSYELENEIVFSCGSGLTACILHLAADQVMNVKMSVYDGSWTEWAERNKLFVG